MLKFERILLPVDFLDTSKPVVHEAAALARHFHSEIVLLHAVTPLSYSAAMLDGSYVPYSLGDLQAELLRQAERRLDRFLMSELAGIKVQRILLEGDPANVIIKTARDIRADLIMMPTHGYGAFRRFLLGSVTAKVLHDSEIPVWTGAHLEAPPPGDFVIRRLLCAVDLRAHSPATVQAAAQVAAEFGAHLTLLHVLPPMEPYGPGEYIVEPAWKETLIGTVRRDLAKLQQDSTIKPDVLIESGEAPAIISLIAKQTQADLLTIGRPAGGRLRATGYGIIRESQIPVLSI